MRRYLNRLTAAGSMIILLLIFAQSASACVGKTLLVGSSGGAQQEILAEVLALLISERTGTTVKIVSFDTSMQSHEALLKHDLDMVIEYTGVGQVKILQGDAIEDPKALYAEVKKRYQQDLNLIWLKPLGFDEPRVAPNGVAAEPAPVVRKDTLKKFPALARLINKLGGKIDAETMKRLEADLDQQPARQVARGFLKQSRLI